MGTNSQYLGLQPIVLFQFNGTGTPAYVADAPRRGGGVITDNGVGSYTIAIDDAVGLPANNLSGRIYARAGVLGVLGHQAQVSIVSATSITVTVWTGAGVAADADSIYVELYRLTG